MIIIIQISLYQINPVGKIIMKNLKLGIISAGFQIGVKLRNP